MKITKSEIERILKVINDFPNARSFDLDEVFNDPDADPDRDSNLTITMDVDIEYRQTLLTIHIAGVRI